MLGWEGSLTTCTVSNLPPADPQLEPMSREQTLVAIALTAIVLLIVSRIWLFLDSSVTMLPIRWSWQDGLLGVAIGAGITLGSFLLYRVWQPYRQSAEFYLSMVITSLSWLDLIWLGLLPGLSEELLFRGVMLPAIALTNFGILITSLCFGVMHFSGLQHWAYVVWTTVVGIILGWSAVETGNLLVPVVAHIFTNLISAFYWKYKQA
jgi:uncharacterized protein